MVENKNFNEQENVDDAETVEVAADEVSTELVSDECQKEGFFEKKFQLKKHGTTIRIEVLAGITTFLAMAYILMVNATMFSDPYDSGFNLLGVSYGAIYIATAISAVVGTILIGLLAKLPLAQASGMGLNAFFVYTLCDSFGLSYANALVLVLLEGIIFIVLTVTGVRKKVFDSIPKAIRAAIPAGIGLFIAYIGLQSANIIYSYETTVSALISFNILGGDFVWADVMPAVVTIIGLLAITIMTAKKVKGAVLLGIIGSAILYYILGFTTGMYSESIITLTSPFTAFSEFFDQSFLTVFTDGFDFSDYIEANSAASLIMIVITSSIAYCIVDMFETVGTLYGACSKGNMLTESGEVPNMDKALLADACATTFGSICGTSTVTTYVESSTGVVEGGRTGLTSLVTAACFFLAMFLSPIAQLIPSCATATALIFVGALMIDSVRNIEWSDITVAVPAFLTMIIMLLSYNISYGIGFGIISYTVIAVFTGKMKEVKIGTYVFAVLFLLMFILTH